MTDKTAIDALKIAREALKERRAYCEQWEYKYGDEWDNEDGYIQDAIDKLAAIEAEKPAEDGTNPYGWQKVFRAHYSIPDTERPLSNREEQLADACKLGWNLAISANNQYAESYHAEQCKACARQNQWMPKSVLPPVNCKPVICIHNQDEPFIGFFDYDDDEWYDVENMIRDVTHWQPLPEAPK